MSGARASADKEEAVSSAEAPAEPRDWRDWCLLQEKEWEATIFKIFLATDNFYHHSYPHLPDICTSSALIGTL